MKMSSKVGSLLALPAAFLLAFVLAFLAMGAADAFAQPEAAPAGEPAAAGFAPPNDGPEDGTADHEAGDAEPHAGAAAHGGVAGGHEAAGHGDPSKHFNFFDFGWSSKDAYGGTFGDGVMTDHDGQVAVDEHGRPAPEEPMSAPFIFMVLNFVILLAILVSKGGPAARKMAEDRHDQIKNALEEAAKLRTQAADKLSEYEARLKDADAEIKSMVEGMRKDAELDKQRILDNAERQAVQMKRDAELRIAAEIANARAMLTREVTAAAAGATEKLLREKLVAGDQSKLVASFITDVQTTRSQTKERV